MTFQVKIVLAASSADLELASPAAKEKEFKLIQGVQRNTPRPLPY